MYRLLQQAIKNISIKNTNKLFSPRFNLNKQISFNFGRLKSLEKHYDLKITDDKDVESLKNNVPTIEKSQSIHLDIRDNKLDKEKFKELFQTVSKGKVQDLHLDLTNISLDAEKLDEISK